jgi:hypothetical protein
MSAKMEKYKSMAAMKKHEKMEGPAARKKEYGSATGGLFGTKKKAVAKKTAKKSAIKKMGKK